MRVVIVGAGQVGSNIAASLAPTHEVIVVDRDPEVVDTLTYSLDVLTIEGDGASRDALTEADVGDADMLIASTDDDETNLVTCSTAKTLGDTFTIARVRNVNFLETWNHSQGVFGVDFMVCTDLLAAETVVRVIGLPVALDADSFARGLVQMAEFEITEGSPVADRTVAEADQWDELTFAAFVRNGDITIPNGETGIEVGDRVIVIGSPASIESFARSIKPADTPDQSRKPVIVGGSPIGYQIARLLEDRGFEPRLIEKDSGRSRELAEKLPGTVVLEHDGTDVEFLAEEHVDRADVVIAALGNDEKNLLVSLLARNIGVDRTVAIVENGNYTGLFETVGVDVAISPREVTAEEIIKHTHEGQAENLSLVEDRKAEVLEVAVNEESALAGQPIRETVGKLPADVVIGAITRGDDFVVPRGDTTIEAGDHVVLFVDIDDLDAITAVV